MPIKIGRDCYIAPTAVLIGDVTIGDRVMICDNAILRGDTNFIRVSSGSNIQDSVTIHGELENPVLIGSGVSIGHNSVVHGCSISDNVLVGMSSVVMSGAIIGKGSVIGAHSLVTERFKAEENSLIMGSPAKVIKRDQKYRVMAELNSLAYEQLRENYLSGKYDRLEGKDYISRTLGDNALS